MAIASQSDGFMTLLKKKNFLAIWLAQLISMTIFNASNYALLILIENVTHSTTLIGLAIISFSLPAILIGAPAGVFVDHMNKRRVLWASNCLRAIVTFFFVITLLVNRSSLIIFYLLTFVISAIGQFFSPAEGSTIPKLVSEDELIHALSLFNVTFMLSQALGYILIAPLAISLLPTFTLFHMTFDSFIQLYTIVGVLYLVCALLVSLIPGSLFEKQHDQTSSYQAEIDPLTTQAAGALRSVWDEIVQGWRFVRQQKGLFLAVTQLSYVGILILVIGQLVTPIVTQLLYLPSNTMAFIFAPAGIGLVVGSIFMPGLAKQLSKSRAVVIGCTILGLATGMLPLLTIIARWLDPNGWNANPILLVVVGIVMFLAGIGLDFVNIPAQTAMQEYSPEWIKGRVLAFQLVLYNACAIPIILFIGAISDIFGIDRVLYVLAISNFAFACWGLSYQRRHPEIMARTSASSTPDKDLLEEMSSKHLNSGD